MKPRLLPLAGLLLSLPAFAQWSTSGNTASKSFRLGTNNNVSLRMFTNGTQKAIITPSGNVGFGVEYPNLPFEVAGRSRFYKPVLLDSGLRVGSMLIADANNAYGVRIKSRKTGLNIEVEDNEDPMYRSETGINVFAEGLGIAVNAGGSNGVGIYTHGGLYGVVAGAHLDGFAAILARTPNSSGYAAEFDGDVYTTGMYNSSDTKLKTDVQDFKGLDIVGKLKPKNYLFVGQTMPTGRHYGLIAQDVEKIAPSLVKNVKLPDSELKAVNYIELIPVLIKSMQEQQAMIEELKDEVARLKGTTNAALSSAWVEAVGNPVKATARMRYNVPEGNGRLLVLDVTGRQVKSIALKGAGTLNLDVSGLASGVYNYSLVVDGRPVETKRLTVQR